MTTWHELAEAGHGMVRFESHHLFKETAELVNSESVLAFRSRGEIETALNDAGFAQVSVFGDWDGRPFHEDTGEIIVVAN